MIVGLSSYLYMVIQTSIGTGAGLSLTTFALWAALAWISGSIMKKKGGNPTVPFIYGLGATATTVVLLLKGRFDVSLLDGVIFVLVLICIRLLFIKNDRLALIVAVTAGCITPIPFIIMTWKAPELSPILPNTGFFLANILLFFSGKTWTLEDRLYGGANAFVCSLLIIPWLIA